MLLKFAIKCSSNSLLPPPPNHKPKKKIASFVHKKFFLKGLFNNITKTSSTMKNAGWTGFFLKS